MHDYWVYIVASRSKVIYTGITNDLKRRILEHKNGKDKGFTSKYNASRLVYFEQTSDVQAAITREKQIKGFRRAKKVTLIEAKNPDWCDLSEEWDWKLDTRD